MRGMPRPPSESVRCSRRKVPLSCTSISTTSSWSWTDTSTGASEEAPLNALARASVAATLRSNRTAAESDRASARRSTAARSCAAADGSSRSVRRSAEFVSPILRRLLVSASRPRFVYPWFYVRKRVTLRCRRLGDGRKGSGITGREGPLGAENHRSSARLKGGYADDLERLDQLRPGEHPYRAGCRAAAQGGRLQDPPPRMRDADQAEALLPLPRARRGGGRAREGLGVREGPVRDRRGRGPRGGRRPALAVDRHPALRSGR